LTLRITAEGLAYGVIVLVGLAVRLAALGRWPLLEGEIGTAMAAWRALQGQIVPAGGYIPLLFNVHSVLFRLTHASDAGVRLLPALVGAGLPALPCLARGYLGRRGALAAALLLAFSPTWVHASRTADGAILAAAAGALLVISLWRYLSEGHAGGLRWGALALGIGLAAGAGFYTVLLALLLYAGTLWLLAGDDARLRIKGLAAAGATRRNGLLVAGAFVTLAAGLLLNLGGVGAAVGLAGRWARALAPGAEGLPWTYYGATLLTYEFLTVALALVGAVVGLSRRNGYDGALAFWATLALLLGTLLGHRHPQWLPVGLLPLVFLAGRGVEWLWGRVGVGADARELLALLAGAVPLGMGAMGLAAYLHTGQQGYLTYLLVGLGMLIVGLSAYGYQFGSTAGTRLALALTLATLLVPTVRATTALAYETARDPRERMVVKPTSVQVAQFAAYAPVLSSRTTGKPGAIDAEYEAALEPWMGWYLRDFDRARSVPAVGPFSYSTVLITVAHEGETPPADYAGRRFRLQETWPEQPLSLRERLRWFLYRYPAGQEGGSEFWLWVLAAPVG
jgi:uncharacterized protein (TIGR03663 family)